MESETELSLPQGWQTMVMTLEETSELTDEQLASQTLTERSDGPAFVTLVGRFRERVWRVCFRLMGNAEDASDAAQEVLIRMFLHRDRFQGRSKYSTWVHGIAVNTCLTLRRSRGRRIRRESALSDKSSPDTTTSAQKSSELAVDLMQMLDMLDETDRALLILKYAEEQSYEELAETFGLSISACKMRVSRARDKLKQRYPEASC